MLCLFLLGIAVSVAAGVWLSCRAADAPWESRLALAVMPAALFVILAGLLHAMDAAPRMDWNGCRLYTTAAMLRGCQLYCPPDSGPILDTIYGPVCAIVYIPAALLSHPRTAVMLAALINYLFYIAPVFLAHWVAARDAKRPGWEMLSGACLMLTASCFYYGTWGMMVFAHADGPCVGLGLLSCLPLMRGRRELGTGAAFCAATLAILSVATKQIAAPLPLAHAAYVALAMGRRSLAKYVLSFLATGALLFLLACHAFGFREMWFSMVTVPSGHAWKEPGWYGLYGSLTVVLIYALPWLILIGTGAFLSGRAVANDRPPAVLRPWVLPAVAGLAMIPTSALGCVKVGGEDNNLHCLFFLSVAASLLWTDAGSGRTARSEDLWDNAARKTAAALLCLFAAAAAPKIGHLVSDADARQDQETAAYECARSHPGAFYFPWNPLASLLAEGETYHVEDGVQMRALAGYPPGDTQLRQHLPRQMRFIAYPPTREHAYLLSLLPEFRARVEVPELPGWKVYARQPAR